MRQHRSFHWKLWLVLTPVIAIGLFLALTGRKKVPAQAPPTVSPNQ